jgi:hypothetical protein
VLEHLHARELAPDDRHAHRRLLTELLGSIEAERRGLPWAPASSVDEELPVC